MEKVTKATKAKDIQRGWHLFDAKGKILGRLATDAAQKLIGKNKPYFVTNMDCGDHVVIINAGRIEVSGNKEKNKKYTNYSGYPGGLRVRTYEEVKNNNPEDVVRHAVMGMLPKNKLRSGMIKRLHVFNGEEHDYKDKFLEESASGRNN